MEDNEFVELYGYKVFKNGKIFNSYNKEITQFKNSGAIKININGKQINVPILKFIYYAFNRDFDLQDKTITIVPKDMNKDNLSYDNLKVEKKENIIWGENSINSKLTDTQVEEIKDKYKNRKEKYCTYRSLADEYGVSHSLISGIIKGRFRNKKNYILKKEIG